MLNVASSIKWLAGALLVAAVSTTAVAHNHGKKKDIVDIAASDGQFSTLVTAVKAAGLVDTLKGDGPFTVFAPTNDAFAALPEGTLDSLLKPENKDQLVAVLTYHVLGDKVPSSAIAGKELSTATVQGEEVAIDATDGVQVGGANVVKADIMTSNGVIHVIDAVILPPSMR
ncbi:fasciclin domain-containing protein [Pseudidiomarina homiensis]|uniref:Nex18 symbiotically induced protein n=1 Tax=Pseudidiomarina homiensis TaxID=364198 RepID=A0A432Y3H2_9GAMM|nr:fasciclin domain-containing protein [Pseudidiomarina homiensis]RUO55503.1 Nex18 symbiotically induced protein [Pseudidiomarina homiensis]